MEIYSGGDFRLWADWIRIFEFAGFYIFWMNPVQNLIASILFSKTVRPFDLASAEVSNWWCMQALNSWPGPNRFFLCLSISS